MRHEKDGLMAVPFTVFCREPNPGLRLQIGQNAPRSQAHQLKPPSVPAENGRHAKDDRAARRLA